MSSWLWGRQEKRSFNVMIYEQDYKELCAWVLKKPNIETGGDLFGLWADEHTAVIQLVLGPGKSCTRTTASFYQDIDYLRRVGSYLTQNEGVCHIGEWHSHHQLGLARPSGGDENTVWNNMPTYNLKRFVIFIANIQSSKQTYNVNVGCFLFEIDDQGKHMDVLPGNFTILQKESPLLGKKKVSEERNKGAEKDDQNTIAFKDLKMEVKEGGNRPSVTYLKPVPVQNSERKRGNRGHHSQTANQNKPNDDESSVDSKKRKMNTAEERSPGKTSGKGKYSPEESPPSEDLKNLTINNEQQQENSEEAMGQEKEKEQPEKNNQEECKHEEEREKPPGGKRPGIIEENNEAGPSHAEQGKTEKEGEVRPLPELKTTPEEKAQKQEEEEEQTANTRAAKCGGGTEEKSKSQDGSPQGSRPLPTAEGKEKKLRIEIKAIGRPPKPPGVKKAGSSQTGSRKPPTGSLPNEDVNKLTTNDEQPKEKSEEATKEQEERERQEKKNQEKIKHDEQHDDEKGKSQGRNAENLGEDDEDGSPQAEQGKVEKASKPRPLPKLGTDEQHDDEKGKSQGRNVENLGEDNEAGSPQAEQGKVEKASKPRPLPKLGTETTPEAKKQQKEEQDKETTNKRAAKSGAKKAEEKSLPQGSRPLSTDDGSKKKSQGKKKADQTSSAKKAGPSQTGSKKSTKKQK